MMVALLVRAVSTRMRRYFVQNFGPFCNGCVLGGTVCHGHGSEYVDSTFVDSCVRCLRLEERSNRGEEIIVA